MNFIKEFYDGIVNFGSKLQSPLLLALRLYFGYHFYLAGMEKLQDPVAASKFFAGVSIPFPLQTAYLVGGVELVGGIALVLGLAARLFSIPLILTMLGAYYFTEYKLVANIFQAPDKFIAASPFNFLLTSLLVLAFGPGCYSLDCLAQRWIFKDKGVKKGTR